ncbi:MAG: hypothetical protein QOG62_454 [Thermoleophilaceae bacterium]|jgi:glycosyltransferase involved in cell wall biosynthesis|nr:hypothetical protein [Thermoleophilaceae bacterium]
MPDTKRALAIVVARDEEAALPAVLAALPAAVGCVPLDVLVVDDGSTDVTARLARQAGATIISHGYSRGLGAALRTGLAHAANGGYRAAVYLDGDGEYDPAEADTLIAAVLDDGADYVIGSRFLGTRIGMATHRSITNRLLTSLMSALTRTPMTDSQSGYRAFSPRALALARIRHDYNYAQVLTLSLWGQRIEPVEVPITYARRTSGASFIRHGEYLRKVTPALIAEYREARSLRRRAPWRSPSVAPRPSPRRS